MQVISRYDQSGGTEWVQIPKGPGYSLNTSNIPVKLRILDELNTVLAGVGVASRREALAAWAGMRAQQEEARQAAIQAEQERFARERAAEEARHAADVAKKQALRATAISVVGIAVTALWIIGLTLALLAIERNTRALREVSRRQEATGAALPTTQAAVPETVS